MSEYSSIGEVTAFTRHLLAGQSDYNSTTRPTRTEVSRFITRASAVLDLALAGEGFSTPITVSVAKTVCDDWVTARAVEYVELTQRGVGYSEGEGSRLAMFRNMQKSANEFVKQSRQGLVRLGATVSYGKASGLEYTGLVTPDNRSDTSDTSLVQPKFTRGLFDNPQGSGAMTTEDEDE